VKAPIGWLRDYVDLDGPSDAIAEKLSLMGFPVEAIERRPNLSGVVAGRIVETRRHPNADRLQLCIVDVAADEPLTIATAATNVAAGQLVPVARIGAELVDGEGKPLRIERRPMRGIESQGMLCSAFELVLEGSWFEDGILQLDADTLPGSDVVAAFRLLDDVLDVEVTANRPDAMSIVGLARELGATLGRPVREPVGADTIETLSGVDAVHDGIRISLESPDCRRFVAQRFANVHQGAAPLWLRVRLALAGQRPIGALVDVGNFVMLELGQPLHVYDLAKIAGKHLVVRDARAGEPVRTLDSESRTLDERSLVIADDDGVQSLAGLMGAAASEVEATTREVVVESATFAGPRVRRISALIGLRTDASSRQERGLPPALADAGSQRAAALLATLGAEAGTAFAVGATPLAQAEIAVTTSAVADLLGVELTAPEMRDALRSLGFSVRSSTDGEISTDTTTLLATPPYWRNDVVLAADLIEEIARAVGYERIDPAQPAVPGQSIPAGDYGRERAIANALSALGYHEVMTIPLQPRTVYDRFAAAAAAPATEPVEIANPLSEDQRYLRFSLLPGLLALAARHGGTEQPLRLFEIGHTFERNSDPKEPDFEIATTAWLLVTPAVSEPQWRDDGYLAFKGDSVAVVRAITGSDPDAVTTTSAGLHPGKTACLLVDGRDVAKIGAVDPRLLAAYDIRDAVYAGVMLNGEIPPRRTRRYRAPSRFPAVERDLALVLATDVPACEIELAIRAAAPVAGVDFFDEYRGAQVGTGRKSLGVRITFQRDDATLTDAEVERSVATILAALRERFGAEIRT
jgi:phenylalanyl-tRNA synthetase beta chain